MNAGGREHQKTSIARTMSTPCMEQGAAAELLAAYVDGNAR